MPLWNRGGSDPGETSNVDDLDEDLERGDDVPTLEKSRRQILIEEVRAWLIMAGLLFLTVHSVAQAYNVPSGSMEDTILIGDFLWANKFLFGAPIPFTDSRLPAIREPRAHDIIVFRFPGDGETEYIKRCVGIEGDVIELRNGRLHVNGVAFREPRTGKYVDLNNDGSKHVIPRGEDGSDSRDNFGPYTVPPDHYFMMGDNRDNSFDSRGFGPVHRDLIVGKALFVYMSWDDSVSPAPVAIPGEPTTYFARWGHNLLHLPQKIRWSRIGDSLM